MVKPRSIPKKVGRAVASLPSRIPVELAVLEKEAPDTDDWLHEVKFDGYRMLARMDDGMPG
jgi:bifunctional non-homologous end joining protein LigD